MRMHMQSSRCFVLVIVSLCLAFTCIDRQSVFVNNLSVQVPTGALLAIGCLQPPSSLASHASSASLQLLRRYTSVLVGVALLGHHAAEAELLEVTPENFNRTSYYGSSVSLTDNDEDILITLGKHHNPDSITWKFRKGVWKIVLDKCDDNDTNAVFEIADACKWQFVWDQPREFKLLGPAKQSWDFPTDPPPPYTKLLIELKRGPPRMSVTALTLDGDTLLGEFQLSSPDFCMLNTTADFFKVSVTLTQNKCPVNVTIMNAHLLHDINEPTTQDYTTTLPTWTDSAPEPCCTCTNGKDAVNPEFRMWAIYIIVVLHGALCVV